MRSSFRFLTLLLLGPLASFAPPADRASAASSLEEAREEALLLRGALEPALPVGGGWTTSARVEALDGREAPRRLYERRLTAADFDAMGGFALQVPRPALTAARHRLTLSVRSGEGRALWTASASWEEGAEPASVRDLGRLALKRV